MTVTACQTFAIRRISTVQRCGNDRRIIFEGELEATLTASHPDFGLIESEVIRCQRERRPVGVAIDADGKLVDLDQAHEALVSAVEDDEDPNRVNVGFWGFCPTCYLSRDHSEYQRIRTTLLEAMKKSQRVLFANALRAEESETEIWNRLLDVRSKEQLDDSKAIFPTTGVGRSAPVAVSHSS